MTKLHVPVCSNDVVIRQRLEEKLDRYANHKLTVITAPSGYGKLTLVACWARRKDERVALVPLDTVTMMQFVSGTAS